MKTLKIGVMLLALLLAAMAIVPMVNAADDAMSKENAIRSVSPNISKEDFNWLSQRDIIAASGTVPVIKEKESWEVRHEALRQTLKTSGNDLKDFLYPEGPVIGYGIDYLGCIEIDWFKDINVDQNEVDKIVQIIKKNGEMNGIKETPVFVMRSELAKADVSRSATYRPIVGGVQMQAPVSGGTSMATLGFSATTDPNCDECAGYVITSHLPTTVGQTIYQPSTGSTAGTVDRVGSNYADAAFVYYWNSEGTIVGTNGSLLPVKSYGDAVQGQTIYMSGISSQGSGTVTETDVMIYHGSLNRWMYNQHRASYTSLNGDSGAPVYWMNSNNQVAIGGIHWGHTSTDSYYSPISAVQDDLGVTPILHY